jgi:hypothetical protein
MSDDSLLRPATARVIDFAQAKGVRHWRQNGRMHEEVEDDRPDMDAESMGRGSSHTHLLASHRQIRRRANRRIRKGQRITDEAFKAAYKDIDEWDDEELARGRPRDTNGQFRGAPYKYIPREVHERAVERFKVLVREQMNVHSIEALKTIQMVLESDEVDHKGKPIVPASTKLDAAKFLLEHIVGKPVQPTQSEVSVKLQGILGAVMVNPSQIQNNPDYALAHVARRELTSGPQDDLGVIDVDAIDDEEGDDD